MKAPTESFGYIDNRRASCLLMLGSVRRSGSLAAEMAVDSAVRPTHATTTKASTDLSRQTWRNESRGSAGRVIADGDF